MSFEGFESAEEALKIQFAPIFLAFQDVIRDWPGGATGAFLMLEWNPKAALMQMSPNNFEHAPSLLRFLRLLDYMQPRPVAQEIASLVGCITVPGFKARPAYNSNADAVFALGAALRKVLYEMDAMCGKPTWSEASALKADLAALIDAAHVMSLKLNG